MKSAALKVHTQLPNLQFPCVGRIRQSQISNLRFEILTQLALRALPIVAVAVFLVEDSPDTPPAHFHTLRESTE
jgi:hypothetical protein